MPRSHQQRLQLFVSLGDDLLQTRVCVGLQHGEYNRALSELREDYMSSTCAPIGCHSRKSLFICIKLRNSQLCCIAQHAHLVANSHCRSCRRSVARSSSLSVVKLFIYFLSSSSSKTLLSKINLKKYGDAHNKFPIFFLFVALPLQVTHSVNET